MSKSSAQLDAEIAEALTTPSVSPSSGRLKLKRVRPGYYTGRTTTKLNGRPVEVEIEVAQQDEGERRWYTTVERPHDQGSSRSRIVGGDDTFPSKREAVIALEEALRIGFRPMSWGGYAVSA